MVALTHLHVLHHATADKLVFCHEAMHLQLRMQDAGWAPDVERWESDSDSDASADEAEADETAGTLSERGSAAASDGLSWAVGLYRNSEKQCFQLGYRNSRNVSNM